MLFNNVSLDDFENFHEKSKIANRNSFSSIFLKILETR